MEQNIANNTSMNIYQKLAKIRKIVEVIQKNKKSFSYNYVSADIILAKVTAGMEKYHVSLIPRIVMDSAQSQPIHYTNTKITKTGEVIEQQVNEMLFTSPITYTWVNDDDPDDSLEIPWYITGSQQNPSQAMGSAMTYGLRYFLLQFFQVATPEDDPDNWRGKQREAEEQERLQAASSIVGQINALCNEYVADHPDSREKLADIVKKYARDKAGKPTPNYKGISDPEVAARLFEELSSFVYGDTEKVKVS